MDTPNEMALFVRVVDSKGFRAAADHLGISPSVVSKYITRLEDRLSARLLNRTTRRLALTEVGRVYYEHAQRILAEIEEAERVVSESQAAPQGLLRLSVPLAFGRFMIAPVLPDYLFLHPKMRISVVVHDREVDLIEEGFDLVIRSSTLKDSTMIARRLIKNRRVVCATPGYFEKHGTPLRPDALADHNCLINPAYSHQRTWSFNAKGRHWVVSVSGNLEFDNPLALREAARKGLGVVLLPQYVVQRDLDQGVFQAVLTDFVLEDPDVFLVYPSSKHLSSKVRSFVDFLVAHFKAQEQQTTLLNKK